MLNISKLKFLCKISHGGRGGGEGGESKGRTALFLSPLLLSLGYLGLFSTCSSIWDLSTLRKSIIWNHKSEHYIYPLNDDKHDTNYDAHNK